MNHWIALDCSGRNANELNLRAFHSSTSFAPLYLIVFGSKACLAQFAVPGSTGLLVGRGGISPVTSARTSCTGPSRSPYVSMASISLLCAPHVWGKDGTFFAVAMTIPNLCDFAVARRVSERCRVVGAWCMDQHGCPIRAEFYWNTRFCGIQARCCTARIILQKRGAAQPASACACCGVLHTHLSRARARYVARAQVAGSGERFRKRNDDDNDNDNDNDDDNNDNENAHDNDHADDNDDD